MLFSRASVGEEVTIVLENADGSKGRTVQGTVTEADEVSVVVRTSNGHEQRIRRGRVHVYSMRYRPGME